MKNSHYIIYFSKLVFHYLTLVNLFRLLSAKYLIKVKIEKVMHKTFKGKTERKTNEAQVLSFTRMFGPTSNTNFLLT